MYTKTYKNGITVSGYSNNWINISYIDKYNNYINMRYLYYTRREALKLFKTKYNLK